MERLDPRLEAYLQTNRAFMAPAVELAIASLQLTQASQILDAGTGGGGALAPLVRASAADTTVLGIDLNPGVISMAAEHAEKNGVSERVELSVGDLRDLLTESANADGTFDAIWASDVVWPGNFKKPLDVVRKMAAALKSDGTLALFYSNYYQAMFLPGHSRLERQLRTASELRWGLPGAGPTHSERHVEWLILAGLNDVDVRIFPRVGFPVDSDPTVRPYLEQTVFPELLESARSCGSEAGMSATDIADAEELLSPESARYLPSSPATT